MKLLKITVKTIGLIFLAITTFLLITYFSVEPQFEIPKTVANDASIPHITIDSVTFHAETFGVDTAQTIIVVHGGPGQDYRYLLPLQALSDSFRIVFYDQRGTGLSPRVDISELSMESSLSDLNSIVDYYSPNGKVHLIGHSWGAMLTSGYIAAHPDKVDKAVLAEPGFLNTETANSFMERSNGMMPPMTFKTVWRMLKAVLESTKVNAPDEEAGMDYLMARIIGMNDIEDHPMAKYFCNEDLSSDSTKFWRLGMQASQGIRKSGVNSKGELEMDLVSGLQNFNNEVLFLVSECNTLIGKDIQEYHMSFFPKAKMEIVKNAGHNMIGEKPNESLAAIRQYLIQ
ncbi:alpha/beta fold hydrolase [Carboxylicivirga sp. N1Y90]|uniref:alpha/beta fold hydrolase n=1 Tax=Carboxylicivirga fragile TaxID=3417571 RepID=UPI003D343BB5|nr:alpha/beta hydrolase [Marinilabiliaceae bacterium N1Y90]